MASDLLIATRSTHKLAEIRDILAGSADIRLLTLVDAGVQRTAAEDDVESTATFVGNALAKARFFARLTGLPTLADDSGLCVDALDGGPGVRTRRFAIDRGAVGPAADGAELDAANNRLLLELLSETPPEHRGAHYVCAAALVTPTETAVTAVATCAGVIAPAPTGEGGFGYDPLFLIPTLGVTFAELTSDEKHRRSHRARALRALAPSLRAFSAHRLP